MIWEEILRKEVERTSISRVATALEFSRTTVSLVLSGKYNADTRNIAERVMTVFGKVPCPYLGQEIPMPTCQGFKTRPVPTSHPAELRHWRTCYSCKAPEILVGPGRDN